MNGDVGVSRGKEASAEGARAIKRSAVCPIQLVQGRGHVYEVGSREHWEDVARI